MHRFQVVSATALTLAALTMTAPAQAAPGAAPARGDVQIVQAVPGAAVKVTIDGKAVKSGVGVGAVLGPFKLAAGKHDVTFTDVSTNKMMRTTVTVKPGSNTDVVLHRPATVSGAAVVNTYSTPRKAIGPGKARVLVAHTATVAPADVRVDGTTVFTNIANGEYAQADVPAGRHRVALVPSGTKAAPILGPLTVNLKPQTVTMVYAVGRPSNGSMKVIAHSERLTDTGTAQPSTIDTGSAGLVADSAVTTFGAGGRESSGPVTPLVASTLLAAALVAGMGAMVLRGSRSALRAATHEGRPSRR